MNIGRFHRTLHRGLLAAPFLLLAPIAAAADGPQAQGHENTTYEVRLLPSLGGPVSRGSGLNPRGWVAGFSDTPEDATRRATLWIDDQIIDLGTLGDPATTSSSVAWPGLNHRSTIAGISQTDDLDPLGQQWSCARGGFLPDNGHVCRGFAWMDGVMEPMPTLGGHNSFAAGINNRDQIVGWAENEVEDPTCEPPQVLQFQAIVWEPRRDRLQELPPLPGHSASAAVAINDRGQVVGISGDCDQAVGRFSAKSAVLWDRGTVTDLGNLGGTSWHTAVDINQRGDVVGFSNLPDDGEGGFNAHAFLWTPGDGIHDLETLAGDLLSQANAINERRQVVGGSFNADDGIWRAVLWQGGEIIDLNTRVDPDFPHHLFFARDIDNRGRITITGDAIDADTGAFRGFVATPVPAR